MIIETDWELEVPAATAWHLIGTEFGEICEWASAISHSSLDGELAPGTHRTCAGVSFGPFSGGTFQERLVEFDPSRMVLSYQGVGPQPWFLQEAGNRWSVHPRGPESCVVRSRGHLQLRWYARPFGFLFRLLLKGPMKKLGEELRARAES